MKIVYNTDLQIIEDEVLIGYNINIRTDVRIETDSYVLLGTESMLLDFGLLLALKNANIIDYNDFRKYLIVNLLPNWETLSFIEKAQLKGYYVIPNDFVFNSEEEEQAIYKLLVDNATLCRKSRVDAGRSVVSLLYKTQTQKSQDFFIDTEAMMNRFIEGKIPELQAFINDSILSTFDYTTNGFSTKSYYTEALKDKLNYILFR